MWSGSFWKNAFERALKTFFQVLAAVIVAADAIGLLDVDWTQSLSVAGLAGLLSLFTSIGSSPFGPAGSPSFSRDPAAAQAPAGLHGQ